VPESFALATRDCVFEKCTFGPAEDKLAIKQPVKTTLYVQDCSNTPQTGPNRVIEALRCTTYSLAVMPGVDGGALVSGSQDGTIRVWNIGGGASLFKQNHNCEEAVLDEHTNWVMGMCLLPPGPAPAKAHAKAKKVARKKHADDTSSSDDE
jgi:WD40 repeat protein